jgi:D-alanyl-D-alanine carboxypeptidase
MDPHVVQQSRIRRAERELAARLARRKRRRRRAVTLLGVVVLAVTIVAVILTATTNRHERRPRTQRLAGSPATLQAPKPHNAYGSALAARQINAKLKLPIRSGLLFDVRTGKVLWERDAQRELPIASLTKMMTALVVVAHAKPQAKVLITREALDYTGSGVGMLPLHKKVSVKTLLYGLLLPSGNDAAIALAEYVAHDQAAFIAMMNERAQAMRLSCTHFSTVSGVIDRANYSCASDLAVIAHAVLEQPLLRRIVATRDAILPFPIKHGKLFLYNNNPLLRMRFPGTDGVKTGFTTLAGPCLVASARRGSTWLAVVLLHSGDPPNQAMQLLNAGFATPGA